MDRARRTLTRAGRTSGARPRAGSALRGALLVALALLGAASWLYLPIRSGARGFAPALRVVLVDASASVRRRRPSWSEWARAALRDEAEAARAAGEEFALISFASEVQRGFGPDDAARFLELLDGRSGVPLDPGRGAGDDGASELARALRAGRELLARPGDRRPGQLVVLGDDRPTGAGHDDPAEELRQLRELGTAWRCRLPPPPELPDLALVELELPARVEEGALLTAVATLRLAPGAAQPRAAWLSVELESASSATSLDVPLQLPEPLAAPDAGGETWSVPLDLGAAAAGRTRVVVRARLEPASDPVAENDRRSATCVASGALVVGIAAHEPEAARRWLAAAGFAKPAGLQLLLAAPAELASLLPELDALVTLDMGLAELPAGPLASFVEGGGGWLAFAGWSWLRDWSAAEAESALARLLPLVPAPLEQPPRDVTLLVDGSGSMEGEPFETVRTASLALARAALPADEVELRFFTTSLEAPTRIKPRGAEPGAPAELEAARRLLAARVPGGSTFLLQAIEEYARLREGASGEGLALLLTDGREQEALPDGAARVARLQERLRSARTRLVVIAVGETVDEELLALLAAPGEVPERAEELADLERIFRREISSARWREGREGTIALHPAAAETQSLASQVFPEALRGAPLPALAPVRRLVRAALRPGAEALYATVEGEPVVAVQRSGAGRTAACASAPLADWAPAWTDAGSSGGAGPFGPLLPWLARGTPPRELRARVEGGELVLEGLGAGAPVLLEARLVDGTLEGGVAETRPAGAAVLGRVLLTLPGSPSGADLGLIRRATVPEGLGGRLAAPGLWLVVESPPDPPSWLPLPVATRPEFEDGARLDARLLAGGGSAVAQAGGAPPAAGRAGGHRAAPIALAAGLGLLFAVGIGRRPGTRSPRD